mmetsp:Transcript_17881/g.55337  ORF Transcript_17881/g.55337 Transcript_17881/m.55337 type:complete len:87 (-) Transcript_17881:320-580(-)
MAPNGPSRWRTATHGRPPLQEKKHTMSVGPAWCSDSGPCACAVSHRVPRMDIGCMRQEEIQWPGCNLAFPGRRPGDVHGAVRTGEA